MANLSFKKINKIYNNNVQAVFNFDLEVKDKEFIVFVGPSGCGKSTTLRMVAGLEDISSGELFIDGQLVNNILPKDRDIAMVFQSYALYPHMTVFDNMAFALKLRKSKMPIYEEDEEIEKVRKENYVYLKEIKKIDRQLKSKKVDEALLANKEDLFNKVLANEDYIVTIQKQKIGISNLDIKELSALIDTTLYELKKIQPKIQHKCVQIENLAQRIEKEKNSNVAKLKAKIDVLNKQIRKLEELKIQKQNYLEKNESELKYFKNNEIPLYSLRKHNKYEIYVEVYKTAKILDLTKYIFRKPAALSGGQRQRVALGRAIVRHPKVFLMDEPLSNLDAKLRVQMRSEISKIHEAVGATTIYVTHDQTEAMTMASRIVVMKDGYIQQIGTPSEVYSDPANMFVGGFIGSPSMNFIEGHVEKGSFVINGENPIIIKLSNNDKELLNDVEENIYLGVRPEHIYLNGDVNNTSPTNTLNINCDYAELLGNEFVVYTYLNGQKLVLKVLTKSQIKTHDNIDIAFAKDLLYFFKKDGTRIKKH